MSTMDDREPPHPHKAEPDSAMKHLFSDDVRYVESLSLSNELSNEHVNIKQFLDTILPQILISYGNGKSSIDVLSVGSGSGKMDFHILSSIQKIKPDLLIKNEVIEPSATQITLYKERMSNAPSLSNISFTYQHKKAEEYQQDVNLKKECKKFDFIHMIQMIYYVKDARSTLESFKSCLAPNGKLLIIILSGKSGWINIIKKYEILLHESEGLSLHLCSEDIINMLDTMSVTYETYDIPTSVDITECFIEGSQNGELILDILTEICHFSKNVPSTIKQQIMEDFKSPEFSDKKDGKIFFNTDLIAIIVKNK